MQDREYKNLIFTNHALDRSDSRSVTADAVYNVVTWPDSTKNLGNNKKKFIRKLGDRLYHVVAFYKPHERKWVVVSVWVRGEEDKLPLAWIIISAPFKLIWTLLKFVWRYIFKMYKSEKS